MSGSVERTTGPVYTAAPATVPLRPAVADATAVVLPPVHMPPVADVTQVAASGTAATATEFVDAPAAAPPPQPYIDDPDPPAPSRYMAPPGKVIGEFQQHFGRGVLSGGEGEQFASAILQTMGVPVDGTSAVERLQRKVGAYPDGRFGPQTWALTMTYMAGKLQQNPNDETATAILSALTPGMGGRAVGHGDAPAQVGRTAAAASSGRAQGGVMSRQAGEQMAARILQAVGIPPESGNSVRLLQQAIGASPDGKFGPQTRSMTIAALQQILAEEPGNQQLAAVLSELQGGRPQSAPQRPAAQQPPAQQPAEPSEAEMQAAIMQQMAEQSDNAIRGQLDSAKGSFRFTGNDDDVARNHFTNPSSLAMMTPQTVAQGIVALMNGWTSSAEQKAIMVAVRSQAAIGRLGETIEHLGRRAADLPGELKADQRQELLALASDPASGVTAAQLQTLSK